MSDYLVYSYYIYRENALFSVGSLLVIDKIFRFVETLTNVIENITCIIL